MNSPIFACLSLSGSLVGLFQGWALVAKNTALSYCKKKIRHLEWSSTKSGFRYIFFKQSWMSQQHAIFLTWLHSARRLSHLRYLGSKLMMTIAATSIITGILSMRNTPAWKECWIALRSRFRMYLKVLKAVLGEIFTILSWCVTGKDVWPVTPVAWVDGSSRFSSDPSAVLATRWDI